MSIITRFAPSPTGDLHIGGIRTAIFNWLFAKVNDGKFLLRIEDTDYDRLNNESIKSIIEGLSWLGLNWDEEIMHQSDNVSYHQNIAYQLLELGHAYKCYLTSDELEEIKGSNDISQLRKYRDCKEDLSHPHVIRFKMPLEGSITMHDLVQGEITVNCNKLEDFIILRQDGNPTYPLACVADDHKMDITNVIRGDDHIINAFKQISIYKSLEWRCPVYAHIPLIHNSQGKKLSKRSGDVGISYYKNLGILPEAMFNYLLRLGWSHGDDEIISIKQAIDWFDLKNVGKSPSRLDMDKLLNINSIYIRQKDNSEIESLLRNFDLQLTKEQWEMLKKAIPSLKMRSKTIVELNKMAHDFFGSKLPKYTIEHPVISAEARDFLINWSPSTDEDKFRAALEVAQIKLRDVAPFIRFALSGKKVSPSIFDMISSLGLELSKYRLNYALRI